MPVDGSSARKVPESGSAESVPVRLASIDRQLSAVREILDRVEHALGEVVRIDPAKFAGHEALRSAYEDLKRSLAESRARLARPTFRIYEQFVRTVTLLARNGQLETREAIEAAIEATKENVASIRQNLDQERESFRDQVEQIKAGLAAKGSKDPNHEAMIVGLRQKYAQFFNPLDTFQRQAREDLLRHLVEPLNEAGSSGEATLRRRLEAGISQHLAAEVAGAYRSYLDEIASYKKEGDQVAKRVRKSSSGNLSKAKQAIESLTEKLLEAIDRRALYFVQERARS